MLKLENISGGYNKGSMILQNLSMEINKGESVGIIGLNGSGKSTLAKAIMNTLPHRNGSIFIHNMDSTLFSSEKISTSGISLVMQGGRIFPQLTVEEHLMLISGITSKEKLKKHVEEIENYYKIANFANNWVYYKKGNLLSGGEKQKLALFMALMKRPEILILDEISAGLSPVALQQVSDMVIAIRNVNKTSLMIIEQNIGLATKLCDRILLLEQGSIEREFIIDEHFSMEELNKNIFN